MMNNSWLMTPIAAQVRPIPIKLMQIYEMSFKREPSADKRMAPRIIPMPNKALTMLFQPTFISSHCANDKTPHNAQSFAHRSGKDLILVITPGRTDICES